MKSTFSNLNGSCVEVSRLQADRIGVRDTKDNGVGPGSCLHWTGVERLPCAAPRKASSITSS